MFFVDDGISGTSFDRSDFNRMQRMVEEGKICRIIVKDLSRFGREQVEAGRLTQIVYPSLGVTFISIQENVNSTTGEGMEMLPFYNIFNEWYAAQTSKKIRAVWQSKADNGKRQMTGYSEAKARTFADARVTFTEEQVRKETARCLGCGATKVDGYMCIGCGLCTTKCKFDAIHLKKVRDWHAGTFETMPIKVAEGLVKRTGRIVKSAVTK